MVIKTLMLLFGFLFTGASLADILIWHYSEASIAGLFVGGLLLLFGTHALMHGGRNFSMAQMDDDDDDF